MFRYFVIQTDTHIVEPGNTLYGIDTERRAQATTAAITQETLPIECMVHLGDVCDSVIEKDRMLAVGTPESYEHAREIFSPISCRKLYIPGNHDEPELMYGILGDAWQGRKNGVATFELAGTTLIGVDLRTGPEPTAFLSPETGKRLNENLQGCERAIILTHYPFVPNSNKRISEGLSVLNASDVHEILLAHRSKILALFHGHLHIWGTQSLYGIPSISMTGSGFNFCLEPGSDRMEKPTRGPIGYYVVGVDSTGIVEAHPRYVLFE